MAVLLTGGRDHLGGIRLGIVEVAVDTGAGAAGSHACRLDVYKRQQVLKADYIQVDETTLPVINKQNHKAVKEYLWIVRAVMAVLPGGHHHSQLRDQL